MEPVHSDDAERHFRERHVVGRVEQSQAHARHDAAVDRRREVRLAHEQVAFFYHGNAAAKAFSGTSRTCMDPNINIVRDPRWGRNLETYGEDPLLTGKMAVAFVQGLQGNDTDYVKVGGGCKHFAGYSLEQADGISRFEFNAEISAKDMAETYLPAFAACVSEGESLSVMCSYNAVNGVPPVEILQSTFFQIGTRWA